ncbi:MAG: domain 2, partial [Planctomycetaceae bacterium]|nr:domain 2 [Planctomycetaceae bacterium]
TKTPQGQRSSPSQSPKPDRARARMPRASIESDCGSGPRFIYWADGQQSSPVFLSELRQRIATGHLTRNEFIKPEGDSQWIPAHTVPGLFFADASASSIDLNDAAEIDTTSFERPTVVDPPQPGSVVALPSSPVNAQKNCDKVDDDLAFQSLAPAIQHDNVVRIVKHTSRLDRSGPASWRSRPSLEQETENRLANRIRQRLQFTRQRLFGAFAILLILASMISCYFWATRGKEQVIFDRYASIWEELKAQRTKAIGPDKWSEFQNRVQLENEHFVQILEVRIGAIGNSKARRDAALKLLTIGRDYLPKMLTDARLKPIREEVEFAKQMKQVHEILNGK